MKYVILIIITIIICSCKTDSKNPINPTKVNIDEVQNNEIDKLFQNIDVKEINKKIKNSIDQLSPEQVMQLYYPDDVEYTNEGNEVITITTDGSLLTSTIVTLVHDNLLDDSVRSNKIEMLLKPDGNKWIVMSIKKSWRCWRDADNSEWTNVLCN